MRHGRSGLLLGPALKELSAVLFGQGRRGQAGLRVADQVGDFELMVAAEDRLFAQPASHFNSLLVKKNRQAGSTRVFGILKGGSLPGSKR